MHFFLDDDFRAKFFLTPHPELNTSVSPQSVGGSAVYRSYLDTDLLVTG